MKIIRQMKTLLKAKLIFITKKSLKLPKLFHTGYHPEKDNPEESEKIEYFNSGIYGFLEEFNSYYQGCLFSYNIYPFFRDELEQTRDTWHGYISNLMGSYNAYAEFKYYILTYLLYAQELNSGIYNDIMNNEPYRIAFTIIDDNFSNLIDMIDRRCENLVIFLNERGFNAEIKDDIFYINNYGIVLMRDEYNMLMKEMEKPQYREMLSNLRIESY